MGCRKFGEKVGLIAMEDYVDIGDAAKVAELLVICSQVNYIKIYSIKAVSIYTLMRHQLYISHPCIYILHMQVLSTAVAAGLIGQRCFRHR